MVTSSNRKLVIFDWDGTIMDSVDRIVESMQGAATKAQLPVPSVQSVKDIIGMSLAPAFAQLFGTLSSSQVEQLSAFYRSEYIGTEHSSTPLFAGIEQVLETLHSKGYVLAVATGKNRIGLDRLMKESNLGHFFSDTMTADQAESKPHPQMIETLMTRLVVTADNTVMIGDSILDMTMARNANVKAIGVSYGAHTTDVLKQASPMTVVDTPLDILKHF